MIPDTAHGTNFSSIIIGGYKTKVLKTNYRGRVDIDDLKLKLNEEVAGLMLTQPNTLGLFEDEICTHCAQHKTDDMVALDKMEVLLKNLMAFDQVAKLNS